ncbi:DUF7507 domain-containing protein, partial [Sphingobacterium psychroaquaticum]
NGDSKVNVGDKITYTFKVTNTGNVTLTNVTITDDNATVVGGPIATLAPGAVDGSTFTAEYTLTQADIDKGGVYNLATATGTDPDGSPVTETSTDPTPVDPNDPNHPGVDPGCPTCTITVLPQTGEMEIIKTSSTSASYKVGDIINYTIVVRNTGNVTLHNIVVTDNNADVTNVGTVWRLAVGADTTLLAKHTITQADLDKRYVANIAHGIGQTPRGEDVEDDSNSGNPYTPNEPVEPGCPTCTITPMPWTPIKATDDTPPSINGKDGGTTPSVLENDELDNAKVDPSEITLTPGKVVDKDDKPVTGITMDPTTGVITVDPETPAGEYTYEYTICEVLNPSNCSTATVTINVTAPAIKAVDDNFGPINGKDGSTNVGNVLTGAGEDSYNGKPADLKDVEINKIKPATPNTGAVNNNVPVLDPTTGIVSVPPMTPAGTYEIEYTIEDKLNPGNDATATVTVVVEPAPINAENDTPPSINGKDGGKTPSVLDNDELNGKPVDPKDITLTPGQPTGPDGKPTDKVTMNPDGSVTVDPETPAGEYEYPYRICEVLNPSNCSTATVTITVTAPAISAEDDTFTPVNGKDGKTNVGNVLNNNGSGTDNYNGKPADLKDVEINNIKPATPNTGAVNNNVPVLDPSTGIVSVPPMTPAGTYEIEYTIEDKLNPGNSSTAKVKVVVDPAPILATDDNPGLFNGKDGGKTPSVFDNDKLNGKDVDPKDVTLTPGKVVDKDGYPAKGITMNPDGTITISPETPAGEYVHTYTICEVLNPNNCSTANVKIVVEAPLIEAKDDKSAPINGKDGGTIPSVLENDLLNGKVVNPKDVTLTPGTATGPNGQPAKGIVMNSDGTITVSPETPAGTYTYPYTICEKVNPNNCSSAVATITVVPAPIVAEDDRFAPINGANGGTTKPVFENDKLNNKVVKPNEVKLTWVDNAPAGLTLNADGTITVAPGTVAGTHQVKYRICEVLNPNNCDDAVATIVVAPAPINAADDTYKVEWSRDVIVTESVLVNDKFNDAPIDLSKVTLTPGVASNPGLKMNPDGTISIAPSTRPGTYTYAYTICEVLNPNNCSTAVATITIEASALFIPNVFTPNGDGTNDTFEIVGLEGFDRVSVVIVNRWGNEVYRSENYDNTWTGRGLNEGTYYYIITPYKNGKSEVIKGWVLIKTR